MTKKIAILGSAPSSLLLAPFQDESWDIWCCSPGVYPHAKRISEWYEIHRFEPGQPWFSPEYVQFMAKLECPVYMIQPVPEIPNSQHFPLDQVIDYVYGHLVDHRGIWRERRFDRSDFSSTIAFMIAKAIMDGADEIGLWGVDMAAVEEWFFQRSGCQSLLDVAKSVGIKVFVPHESDLMRPPPLYGFCEVDPAHIKYVARRNELQHRINGATQAGINAQREMDHLRGAMDQLEYNAKTWIGNPFHLLQDTAHIVPPVPAPQLTFNPVSGELSAAPAEPISDDWRTLEGTITAGDPPSVTISSTLTDELLAAMPEKANGAGVSHPIA